MIDHGLLPNMGLTNEQPHTGRGFLQRFGKWFPSRASIYTWLTIFQIDHEFEPSFHFRGMPIEVTLLKLLQPKLESSPTRERKIRRSRCTEK